MLNLDKDSRKKSSITVDIKRNVNNKTPDETIDLLAILQKSLDRALFLYIFIHEVRLSGVRASFSIVHIRKFYKM